jgi:ribosomal protein S27AE
MEEVIFKKAECVECGREVEAKGHLGKGYAPKKDEYSLDNRLYLYWSCPNCGCVQAKIDGKHSYNPSDLFSVIEIHVIAKTLGIVQGEKP